jgi:signal transduction histidine kinase
MPALSVSARVLLAVLWRGPSYFRTTRAAYALPYLDRMARVWRWFAAWGLDVLIVCAAAASSVGTVLRNDADRPDGVQLGFEVVAIAFIPLFLIGRRWWPFVAPASVWVGGAALSFVDHQLITTQPGVYLCGLGAAVLLGGLRRGVQSRVGLVVVLVSAAVVVAHDPTESPLDLVFSTSIFGVAWLVGYALQARVERSEAAEDRALRAERERESAARVAVAEERARMARELHDVVAHAVSVMVLQVGAVRHRLPAASEEGEALRNVEQAGRTALTEMRRMLGALRESDAVELAPGPGLDDLEKLARDVRAAGLDVRLHRQGEPVALPRSLDLSAYRIVQEGLTNALKHSGGRRADVTVDYGEEQIRLEVRDDGPGGFAQKDGFGHGLIGIGERVKAYGGDMSAFVATSGGFVLRASLPLQRADA